MIIIFTVPDPCGSDYDYHSHGAWDFGIVKNCDSFRDFGTFHGRRRIMKNCDNFPQFWPCHGRPPIVKNCYRG